MAFDEGLINDILKHADIVKVIGSYLDLVKSGKNYKAICPFHNDTNPSLTISPEKQIFTCFVCHTGGSAITFVQKYEHISFSEAMLKVAEMSGFHDPRLEGRKNYKRVDETKEPYYKCLTDLSTYYEYALNTAEGKEGLDYFNARHLDADLRNKYKLGYAFKDGKSTVEFMTGRGHSLKTLEDLGIININGNVNADKNQGRVIFPLCDINGNVIGFSARRLKDGPEAKYINSSETPLFHKSNVLYNYHIAKDKCHFQNCIYVVEGFMDVFALGRIGLDNAVATMGTALTEEHVKMLKKLNVEIRLCLDGDLPGQTAMMQACKLLTKMGANFVVVNNNNSTKDPDEILNEDGENALRAYLNNLLSKEDFALNYYKNSNPLKTSEEKKSLIEEYLPILLNISNQLDLDSYLRKLASITGYEVEAIRGLLNDTRNVKSTGEIKQKVHYFKPEVKLLKRLEFAEREFLYQMLHNKKAVEFYEEHIGGFYDETYRQVANFLIDYASRHPEVDPIDLITTLQSDETNNNDALINEVVTLTLEKNHPNLCNDVLLNELYKSINQEKEKIYNKDTLTQALMGKSELEKARIITDYNREKIFKMQLKEGEKEK